MANSSNDAPIGAALRELGLGFEWSDESSCARLGFSREARAPLTLSIAQLGATVRIDAHGCLGGGYTPQLVAERDQLSQEWGLGRAYFNAKTREWDLSIGLYVDGRIASPLLGRVLTHLSDAPGLIERGVSPGASLVPSSTPPSEILRGVGRALTQAELDYEAVEDGSVLVLRRRVGSVLAEMQIAVAGALLMARATPEGRPPVPETPPNLARVNAVNQRIDMGGVGLWYGSQRLHAWVAHPVDAFEITAESMLWTLDHVGTFLDLFEAIAPASASH